ncbi:KN motif and ankyrin repeat domain-containing protein 1-like isoform X2 [Betta splendens]|uniref:KN motif and ankyrin repeat domain-containing protein 1-like isoform X2 n=1 Tax=Betta splendens TaxID=158456 RepID=A0A9W2Y6A7_BETSP|nr:KN motif and ankyrin repeat domain-containing protein 1-like isoform X2 [Betta splendens]
MWRDIAFGGKGLRKAVSAPWLSPPLSLLSLWDRPRVLVKNISVTERLWTSVETVTGGQCTRETVPKFQGTDWDYHSDLDYLNRGDSFQNSTTIKQLSLKRRPKVAGTNVDQPQRDTSYSQWHSAESLSASSDDIRLLGMSTMTRGRPPLPPPHGCPSDSKPTRTEATATFPSVSEFKPKPATRSIASQKQSVETHTHLEPEVPTQAPPQPRPRRRLASFRGVSSPGSVSPFTALGAYNQNNNGNKPSGTESEHLNLASSLGGRGSTGCLRMSPQSSGRTTPVPGIGPMHLQHVRDQMGIALQRLKELEEQVKIIPILQVKISVLQEEKRQLASQLKYQGDNEEMREGTWTRTRSVERFDKTSEEGSERTEKIEHTGLRMFRQRAEEIEEMEQNQLSAAARSDKNTDITLYKGTKENKCVLTRQIQTRSVATQVSKVDLGTDLEAELEVQQLTIDALKEKICLLETELKESALQTEMSRLKLELQAAGARNRADKASLARPSTASAGVEARPRTTSRAAGNHGELQDASTQAACCGPDLKNALAGPDVPMSKWEIRERVETREKRVGTSVSHRSVACGEGSVDVMVCEAKETISRGTAMDPVPRVELGVMATPRTASQFTNTESSSVSRFTNTSHAFSTDSCTNTLLSTQDKHTNTTQAVTRTVSVGNRVRDVRCAPETRTIGVGTSHLAGNAMKQAFGTATKLTRDTGVGFTDVNDNFLVGLKTRNMASGPSHLPDPVTTRSVGVGEGKIHTPSGAQQSTQAHWDAELNHYIETMQRLLGDGDLVPRDDGGRGGAGGEKLCSKAAGQEGTGASPLAAPLASPLAAPLASSLASQPPEFQGSSQFSADSAQCDEAKPGVCKRGGNRSEVKRLIQMLEQQTSPAPRVRSANAGTLQPVVKKQKSEVCSSSRKSMRFLRATTGLDPNSIYEVDCEEVERGGNRPRDVSHRGIQGKRSKGGSVKGPKPHAQRFRLNEKILSACRVLKMHLNDDTALSSSELHDCLETLKREWFTVSSHKSAAPDTLAEYLSAFRVISCSVLQHIANMADSNGNTALHYSVSHSNFGIVNKLLDSDVCDVNQQNKAGYTPIMLAALAAAESPEDMRVVERLFTKGDVDAKASQAGQTALMLAVSHGRMDMVRALLAQGAEVNLQDDEGSTALMCASEHGHADIVRLLLSRPECDAALTDSDDSTALSIALEAGHHDIAVLLYAHANFSKGQTGAAARHSSASRISFE